MGKKKVIEEFPGVVPYPDREVGIEIEMEGADLVKGPVGWETTSDGSLRGESCEWVLSRPQSEEDSFILLDRLQAHLTKHLSILRPSDRCGVHIHVNVQDMLTEDVIKFAILYLVLEDLMVEWCGEDREGNLFCLRAQDAEYIVKCLLEAKKKGTFTKIAGQDIRYASMNITSLMKYGSLEFRAMRTPKDFNRIKTWIKMLLAIKRAATTYKTTEEIIELISMRGGRFFLRSIFGELASEFTNVRLNDRIITAARRVQDVAFAEKWKPKKKAGIEDLPYNYWNKLKGAYPFCSRYKYQFVKWDPFKHQIFFIANDGREYAQEWYIDRVSDMDAFDPDDFDYAHQKDIKLITDMWAKTATEGGGNIIMGMPEQEQPNIEWEDEDPDVYFDEEESEEVGN
jgi:hypothetical protein